jgi:phosphatidylserine/phosphatidylglycerophosphate/cardiolipin synthase-like enzyme
MMDGAARSVDVEVLTYKAKFRDGKPFPTLDDALRRAAARGVHVRLLVSDWATKPGGDGRVDLESIARVPNVEVRIIVIPRWSGGDVPYARVAHAKYMIVDGAKHAWVGTSNWEGDYFTKTRNVGAILDGGTVPGALDAVFESVWASAYSQPISASAAAAPPSSSGPARP